MTKNQIEFGAISGKKHQLARGMYPITQDYTLYINGVSATTTDTNGISASGIELKVAYTIKGGTFKKTQVTWSYIDPPDIPKFQAFVDTMEAQAIKSPQDGDTTQGSYLTPGGATLAYQRNGAKDADFTISNEPNDDWTFRFKSATDVSKFKQSVDNASSWVMQHQSTQSKNP